MEALADATAGAVGGLLSTKILYPLDTCKSKYQAEIKAGNSYKYRSLLMFFVRQLPPTKSLYQGLGAKNLQSVISQFIYFYSYSYPKRLYLRYSKSKRIGTGANLLIAAAAVSCNSIITQPLSRMQTSGFGKSQGLWATLSANWRESFDGLGAALVIRLVQYTVFEQIKTWWLLQKQRAKGSKGRSPSQGPSPVLSAFAAFILGTAATLVTYP